MGLWNGESQPLRSGSWRPSGIHRQPGIRAHRGSRWPAPPHHGNPRLAWSAVVFAADLGGMESTRRMVYLLRELAGDHCAGDDTRTGFDLGGQAKAPLLLILVSSIIKEKNRGIFSTEKYLLARSAPPSHVLISPHDPIIRSSRLPIGDSANSRSAAQLSIVCNPSPAVVFLLVSAFRKFVAEVGPMLWTLFVILLVLWLVGVVSSYTLGGFIHLLLVLALVALVFQLLTGRRTAL